MTARTDFQCVYRELQLRGLILQADADLPSVARLLIGGTFKGSWWGHPKGNAIYNLSGELHERPDVLALKLVSGKVTFVHRDLWSAVYSVATSREPWQMKGLLPSAKALLTLVGRRGSVRADHLEPPFRKSVPELEKRLLILCGEVHTESGAHAKSLESWRHWAKRVGFRPGSIAGEAAKGILAEATAALAERTQGRASLPWSNARRV